MLGRPHPAALIGDEIVLDLTAVRRCSLGALRFIIAHEFAEVGNRRSLAQERAVLLVTFAAVIAAAAVKMPHALTVAPVALALVWLWLRRRSEYRADHVAVLAFPDTGIHDFDDAIEYLAWIDRAASAELRAAQPDPVADLIGRIPRPVWLRDHPSFERRRAAVRRALGNRDRSETPHPR